MSKVREENSVVGRSSKLVSGCVKGPYYGEAVVSGCTEEEKCVEAQNTTIGKNQIWWRRYVNCINFL